MGRTMSEEQEHKSAVDLVDRLLATNDRDALVLMARYFVNGAGPVRRELDAERSAHEETRLRIAELERGLDIGNGEFISWQYAYQQEKVVSAKLSGRVAELERERANVFRADGHTHEAHEALTALAASQAECARLREALLQHGEHKASCNRLRAWNGICPHQQLPPCDCGLAAALAARQPDEALREVCEKVALLAIKRCEEAVSIPQGTVLAVNGGVVVEDILGPPALEGRHE